MYGQLFTSKKGFFRWSFLSILFTLSLIPGFCDEYAPPHKEVIAKQPQSDRIRPTIEVKAGYFIFANTKMRKIYNEGGVDTQVCASYPIWKWLQAYGSIEYLERHGHSRHDDQRTRIWEIPVNLGLKPVIKICDQVHYYMGVGPRFFFVHQHNNSSYLNKSVNDGGVGLFVNTGFNFFLHQRRLLVDVFGEYSYTRVHHHFSHNNVYGRCIQVGGYSFGAGLGYVF